MMFFVETNHQSAEPAVYTLSNVNLKRTMLIKLKEKGILVHAYVKIGGGYVYILNANSFADVRNAFRESSVSLNYECNILEIDQKVQFH